MKIKILFATLLTLALFTAAHAQTPDKTKLDQFFDRLAEKDKAMGSLVVARDGNVFYNRSIGYSQINGTEKKPLTAATRYRVGSITKMFTAAMIFQLVEERKLKLTDTLDKFFPQIPNAKKITIAHILAHRSGIRDVTEDRDFRTWGMTPKTKDELLAFIAKGTPDFEPDAKYSYSNSGYILLGIIVEKVGGKPYQEALKKRITSKIGLKDTHMGTGNIDVNKNESFSYRYVRDWEQQPETHISILFGSGAIISTPTDLTKFIQALFDGKIVSKESLASMKTIRDGYGLGMDTFTYNGKIFYGHTGGIDNFGSWLAYLPEEKLALAYAANAKVYPVAKIVSGVFDIYYNKPFTIPAFDTIEVSPEVLDKYVGVYSIPGVPVKSTVTRDDTTLFIQMTGQSAIPLEAMAQDKFGIESAGIVFEFNHAKNQMIQKRSGRERVFTKEN
ncbi:MAG: beta-lactamase family protein [Acidobacteriota bacterium]|nr:beta-lactamase family protein [Acidobacteriota bacterium]